jgi:hypothetical protein
MLAGQQWLRDAGYAATSLGDDDDGDEEDEGTKSKESMDIEIQLAPWVITRNFVQASGGKGLLKLYGPGDPSGRGEAFSFIRSSNKEIFVRSPLPVNRMIPQHLINTHAASIDQGPPSVVLVADAKSRGMKFSVADQQAAYREEVCGEVMLIGVD